MAPRKKRSAGTQPKPETSRVAPDPKPSVSQRIIDRLCELRIESQLLADNGDARDVHVRGGATGVQELVRTIELSVGVT